MFIPTEIFYEKAKLICEINNSCRDEIHNNVLGNRGKLKIGITISYPDWYIDDLFKDFSKYLHCFFTDIYFMKIATSSTCIKSSMSGI